MPVHLVLRRLLGEIASVDEAWELLRETPYSASSCITVVDAAGGGACFELSPAGVARVEPQDGLLAHTNHFLDGALAEGEAEQPRDWLPGSRARLATAQRAAPQELDAALRLLGDHACEPQAICRHDEPSGEPGRPAVDTVVSLAMRPGVPELRVAAGQPCECAFVGLRGLTARQAPDRANLGRHGRAAGAGRAEITPAGAFAPAEALGHDLATRRREAGERPQHERVRGLAQAHRRHGRRARMGAGEGLLDSEAVRSGRGHDVGAIGERSVHTAAIVRIERARPTGGRARGEHPEQERGGSGSRRHRQDAPHASDTSGR